MFDVFMLIMKVWSVNLWNMHDNNARRISFKGPFESLSLCYLMYFGFIKLLSVGTSLVMINYIESNVCRPTSFDV